MFTLPPPHDRWWPRQLTYIIISDVVRMLSYDFDKLHVHKLLQYYCVMFFLMTRNRQKTSNPKLCYTKSPPSPENINRT